MLWIWKQQIFILILICATVHCAAVILGSTDASLRLSPQQASTVGLFAQHGLPMQSMYASIRVQQQPKLLAFVPVAAAILKRVQALQSGTSELISVRALCG